MLSRDHQTHVLIQLVHRNCNESPYVPCGICLYAEYIQCLCSAIESEVVEALAMFRLPACGACGCLMRPGARLPNAQQSVAQATTAGLALYNCSYTCTYVHTCTIVNTAGPAFVLTQMHNAPWIQCPKSGPPWITANAGFFCAIFGSTSSCENSLSQLYTVCYVFIYEYDIRQLLPQDNIYDVMMCY